MFDEYRRSYKALSELARGCATGGSHVFRFDYFGTGDSWGDFEQASVETWINDIHAAIEEGLSVSGANRVYLLGVRFGGTLAAQIERPDVVSYVFWDLFHSGQDYLKHLAQVDAETVLDHPSIRRRSNVGAQPVPHEMFHIGQALRDGIARLRVDVPALMKRAKVHRIVCHENGVDDGSEYSGFTYDWPAYHDGLLLPKPVLEAIARRLG